MPSSGGAVFSWPILMAFIYLSIFAMKRFFVVVHYYRALCFEFILNSAVTLTLSPFCIVIDAVRRRTSGVSGPFRSANNGNGMSMLRFYTEEAQGLKITPVCFFYQVYFHFPPPPWHIWMCSLVLIRRFLFLLLVFALLHSSPCFMPSPRYISTAIHKSFYIQVCSLALCHSCTQ
jgi:hypothetical protein